MAPRILLIGLAGTGLVVQAQEERESLKALMKVPVTSATKLEQSPAEAPAVVEVAPRDEIQGYGWETLNDVLYAQPGFAPSQDYDRRTVSARGVYEGWNNNHLLLLVDGLPFNEPIYGSALTMEPTPLWMLRSVEVLRGPGSALYGSNAVNGVVSLRTLSYGDLHGSGEARSRWGNDGIYGADGVVGTATPRFNLLVAISGSGTDGNEYPSRDLSGRTAPGGGPASFEVLDHREQRTTLIKLEGTGNLAGWSLQLHDQRWRFNTGHGWIFQIPEVREPMSEARQILVVRWAPEGGPLASQEVALKLQRHAIDWTQRYLPAGSPGMPAGLWEVLRTHATDAFLRAQGSLALGRGSRLLGGVEASRFLYRGDDFHASNVDLNVGGSGLPWSPANDLRPLRPWLEYGLDRPILNTALYLQWNSGGLLGEALEATLGMRRDRETVDYRSVDLPGAPEGRRTFGQWSPRAALVWKATPNLVFKAMTGRAYRAPAPSELLGANTYSLASNVRGLRAEVVRTTELALEWAEGSGSTWRLNLYKSALEDQIDYSPANNNASANLFSPKTAGLEGEWLFTRGGLKAFVNASTVKRLDERVGDASITPEPDTVTWVPAFTAHAGALWRTGGGTLSLQVHHLGPVRRRSSDQGLYASDRPGSLPAFTTFDAQGALHLGGGFEASLWVRNLGNAQGHLAKKYDAPFDYRAEGRTWGVGLRLAF
ncbi:MAG TPA: TonB-dependent receptor [Holophagaceae bacterium]|nr:TonB-dependent receptor [Holophagaceae bacterium]